MPDPFRGSLMQPPSLHRYAYVWNNPLRYVDLWGFSPEGERALRIAGAFFQGASGAFTDTWHAVVNYEQTWAGLKYAATHPVEAWQAIAAGVGAAADILGSGTAEERAELIGRMASEIVLGFVATKGVQHLSKARVGAFVGGAKKSLGSTGSIRRFNVSHVLEDENKAAHIFNPKHNLERLGTRTQVLDKVTRAVLAADRDGHIPQAGPFEVTVTVDGHAVTVRGAVVNGELRYGTIFIP